MDLGYLLNIVQTRTNFMDPDPNQPVQTQPIYIITSSDDLGGAHLRVRNLSLQITREGYLLLT